MKLLEEIVSNTRSEKYDFLNFVLCVTLLSDDRMTNEVEKADDTYTLYPARDKESDILSNTVVASKWSSLSRSVMPG